MVLAHSVLTPDTFRDPWQVSWWGCAEHEVCVPSSGWWHPPSLPLAVRVTCSGSSQTAHTAHGHTSAAGSGHCHLSLPPLSLEEQPPAGVWLLLTTKGTVFSLKVCLAPGKITPFPWGMQGKDDHLRLSAVIHVIKQALSYQDGERAVSKAADHCPGELRWT